MVAIDKIWSGAEKFLIAGPTLIGFVSGLMNYSPGHKYFEVAFQSLCIFVAYLAALIIAQMLDSLFFSAWPIVFGVSRSVLALIYLALTIRQFIEWRSGEVKIYPITVRLRQRLAAAIGHAA